MEFNKSISFILIFVFMLAVFPACSSQNEEKEDVTWAFKSNEHTVSEGSYILFLYSSYAEAQRKIQGEEQNEEKDVLSSQVDGKPSAEWIKEKSIELSKQSLAYKQLYKENNINLNEQEEEEIKKEIEKSFDSSKKYLNKLGVPDEDFKDFSYVIPKKNKSLIKALFGKSGKNPISWDDFLNYYNEKFVGISYTFDNTEEEGDESNKPPSKEALDKSKEKFNAFAQDINSNKKTIKEVALQLFGDKATDEQKKNPPNLKEKAVVTVSQLVSQLSQETTDLILKTPVNKAVVAQIENQQILIQREDITAEAKEKFENEDTKVLSLMKSEELESKISSTVESMKIEINNKLLEKYNAEYIDNKSKEIQKEISEEMEKQNKENEEGKENENNEKQPENESNQEEEKPKSENQEEKPE
ncbi:MAG: hypothetical protein LBT82_02860 [Oscillospiraceae bacterium]|jgi:hypothetical protein|nr:hypothetical protein [Oscillospiraceae bacterium]